MEGLTRFDKRLSTGLALFSLALGAAELIAPRALSSAIGLKTRARTLRTLGVREIASGIAMLARPRSSLGPTARVAGDVLDLVVLGASRRKRFARGSKLTLAILAVAAVAALDLLASQRLAKSSIAT